MEEKVRETINHLRVAIREFVNGEYSQYAHGDTIFIQTLEAEIDALDNLLKEKR